QQVKGQGFLVAKLFMRLQRVARYADDHGAGATELVVQVAELLGLDRAAGSGVLRIEIQHQPFALRIVQREILARTRRHRECGHFAFELELRGGHQFFTGSRMASRFCESQYSMKSSRSCATGWRAGTLIIICTANMAAPVCAAA